MCKLNMCMRNGNSLSVEESLRVRIHAVYHFVVQNTCSLSVEQFHIFADITLHCSCFGKCISLHINGFIVFLANLFV